MGHASIDILKRFGSFNWKIIKYYSFYHVITKYIVPFDIVITKGDSMEPTIESNEILIAEKFTVRRFHLKNNDIVIARHPFKLDRTICKRVKYFEAPDGQALHIPYGYVNLKGDNGENSNDSANYGSVPYALIEGRVFLRIWPLNKIGLFRR